MYGEEEEKELHEKLNKKPPDRGLIERYLGKYIKKYFPNKRSLKDTRGK